MSDALARWFLTERIRGGGPWRWLLSVDAAGFGALVERLRQDGALQTDDVTLAIVLL